MTGLPPLEFVPILLEEPDDPEDEPPVETGTDPEDEPPVETGTDPEAEPPAEDVLVGAVVSVVVVYVLVGPVVSVVVVLPTFLML